MPSFKLTPVPYTITHPFDAPLSPNLFTFTSASQTIALLFHCHFCQLNNRGVLSTRPLKPPYLRSCFIPQQASCGAPTQPPVSEVGVCTHSCVPFTRLPKATSASQTIALLLHAHLRLPNNRNPHGRSCSSFTATSASHITVQLFAVALTSQTIAQLFAALTH